MRNIFSGRGLGGEAWAEAQSGAASVVKRPPHSHKRSEWALLLLAALSSLLALAYGPAGFVFEQQILFLRAQRLWADAVAALGLSLSATLLQTAYSNDLMDPYLLGTLSGSLSLVAITVLIFGLYTLASPLVYLMAFVGALLPGLLVSFVALRRGRYFSLLVGISLTLALQGLASVFSYLAAAASDLPFLPMLIGTTQYVSRGVLIMSTIITLIAFLFSLLFYHKLCLLEYPEGFPRSFGIVEGKAVALSVVVSAAASSSVVTCCGVLPFLGLMGALAGRRMAPVGAKRTLVLSFLTSFIIMTLTDLLANCVETPYGFLPVGAFLSLIGGIVLAFILVKESGAEHG